MAKGKKFFDKRGFVPLLNEDELQAAKLVDDMNLAIPTAGNESKTGSSLVREEATFRHRGPEASESVERLGRVSRPRRAAARSEFQGPAAGKREAGHTSTEGRCFLQPQIEAARRVPL